MPLALAGLVEIVQASFHQYFVAYRTDPATFAIYAVGCLQIPLVEVATASVLNVMMVRMSEQTWARAATGRRWPSGTTARGSSRSCSRRWSGSWW